VRATCALGTRVHNTRERRRFQEDMLASHMENNSCQDGRNNADRALGFTTAFLTQLNP
jgi:hypothetical protein